MDSMGRGRGLRWEAQRGSDHMSEESDDGERWLKGHCVSDTQRYLKHFKGIFTEWGQLVDPNGWFGVRQGSLSLPSTLTQNLTHCRTRYVQVYYAINMFMKSQGYNVSRLGRFRLAVARVSRSLENEWFVPAFGEACKIMKNLEIQDSD